MNEFILPEIGAISPYSSARGLHQDKTKTFVLLDANENPFSDPEFGELNRYPDPTSLYLREIIANFKGVNPENILIGNGSDEVLDLIFRATCRPYQHSIAIFEPTYGMYEVLALTNHLNVTRLKLSENFDLDLNQLEELLPEHKVLVLCNPNNPTASLLTQERIIQILTKFRGLVVVDEAYIDFCPLESSVNLINSFSNLVITQTLSKAWGLAGLRIGILIAAPNFISEISKIKYPYNVNRVSQEIALKRLNRIKLFEDQRDLLLSEREQLISKLSELTCVEKVYPSYANFILVKFKDSKLAFSKLKEGGIITRDRSNEYLLSGCIRITVGLPDENNQVVNLLSELKN